MNSKKKLDVKATRSFSRNLKYLMKKRRGVADLVFAKADELASNPEMGNVIPGTNNTLRKVRLADPMSGKGKSGGFRLIYAWKHDFNAIILCIIYPKSDKRDVSPRELEDVLQYIDDISG